MASRVLTLVIERTVDPITWVVVTGWSASHLALPFRAKQRCDPRAAGVGLPERPVRPEVPAVSLGILGGVVA